MQLCNKIVNELRKQIKSLPEGFYDTFEFTDTGKNYTHPRTIGILCKILWGIKTISGVYVDMRFNNGRGKKFQPDLTGFDRRGNPIIFLDYESPNSSDARVPNKDVDSYRSWIGTQKSRAPYIVITTLPDKEVPDWQVRYTSKSGCNYHFSNKKLEIRKNPFSFWYSHYRKCLKGANTSNVFLVNINGKDVDLKEMKKES
jgi:hypothetical protein